MQESPQSLDTLSMHFWVLVGEDKWKPDSDHTKIWNINISKNNKIKQKEQDNKILYINVYM